MISPNILSHRISLDSMRKLTQLIDVKPYYYQTTKYYNQDVVMEVDKQGKQSCYMEPVTYQYYSELDGLRYIKSIYIPLSIARFEINAIDHKCQSVTVVYKLGSVMLEIEVILNTIEKKRNARQIITNLLQKQDETNVSSISYKFFMSSSNDLGHYLGLLKVIS